MFPRLGTVDTDVTDGTGECERDASDELLDILLCRLCGDDGLRRGSIGCLPCGKQPPPLGRTQKKI